MKFDCKSATVTMKRGATLSAEAAEKALKGAGFGMRGFTGGPPPAFTVVRATVRPREAAAGAEAARSALVRELTRELPSVAELFVEPDGRLTALLSGDARLEEKALAAAAGKRGFDVAGFATLSWPRTAAAYVATLRPAQGAGGASPRAALEGIESVLAAIGDSRGETFSIWTREPCENLEARLRAALAGTGRELARVESR